MARAAFRVLLPLTLAMVIAGAAVGGRDVALSVLLGVGVMAGNHALAVASTGWARVLGPNVMAISFMAFFFRMSLVVTVFAALSTVTWISAPVLAASFCAALAVTLGAECLSYVRGTYVPAWRTAR